MKVGNRVTVKPLPEGHPLKRCEGKVGEVEKIENGKALVDDQLCQGRRVGRCEMREWFSFGELEIG